MVDHGVRRANVMNEVMSGQITVVAEGQSMLKAIFEVRAAEYKLNTKKIDIAYAGVTRMEDKLQEKAMAIQQQIDELRRKFKEEDERGS